MLQGPAPKHRLCITVLVPEFLNMLPGVSCAYAYMWRVLVVLPNGILVGRFTVLHLVPPTLLSVVSLLKVADALSSFLCKLGGGRDQINRELR